MNYLSILLVASGLFLSTTLDKPSKVNFEKLEDVDQNFVQFLGMFEKSTLPYEMNLDEVVDLTKVTRPYDHQEIKFLNSMLYGEDANISKFSRMGPPQVTPLKRFYPTDKTIAVSYLQHGYTKAFGIIMIAIYDLKGNLLSLNKDKINTKKVKRKFDSVPQNLRLSAFDIEHTECFKITEDGLLHKSKYENIWEKDVKEFGPHENVIIERNLVGKEIFEMNADGTFALIDKQDLKGLAIART